MELILRRLTEIDPREIIALMTDPLVRRHMPLARGEFGAAECTAFVEAKEALWREHGYGPWGFVIGGEFAGWGGLQPEDGDADLGIVLHQRFWGYGKAIAEHFLGAAFGPLGFESVIILLPDSRAAAPGILKLGFTPDGGTEFDGIPFQRFRLRKERYGGSGIEREVAGWIHEENLIAALEYLSRCVGYRFDHLDETALIGALDDTDDETEDRWFEYPLQGSPALTVRVARSVGSAAMTMVVRGGVDDVLAARIETLMDVLTTPQGAR